jgi:hypothetical protein
MLYHASIPANDTRRVAAVIAELWQGYCAPFPAFPGSYIAMAGDERGTEIEVCPYHQENVIGANEVEITYNEQATGHSATHIAIATPLKQEQVLEIAAREGWSARRCNRGGMFHVIEFWVENNILIEVLTPEMQREYGASVTPVNWERVFGGVERAPEH